MPEPVIDTARLVMRAPTPADFDDCAALWADPEVTRFISGRPATIEESWTRLLRYIGHWAALGFGYWAVRERSTGRYVGEVGFADYKRDIDPPLGGAPEIGWVLATAATGQGFGFEAVAAALAWGDLRFAGRNTVCIIDPSHERSLRLAEKVGYTSRGQALYKGKPCLILDR